MLLYHRVLRKLQVLKAWTRSCRVAELQPASDFRVTSKIEDGKGVMFLTFNGFEREKLI